MKVYIYNPQGFGDAVIFTSICQGLHDAGHAVRCRTGFNELQQNAPWICGLSPSKADIILKPRLGNDMFRECERRRIHITQLLGEWINEQLGTTIAFDIKPRFYFAPWEEEPIVKKPYWLIVAGDAKYSESKHYPHNQAIVDAFPDIHFVQAGSFGWHDELTNVTSYVNKTSVRQVINLCRFADGIVCPITFALHIGAAFDKPTVVIAGGKEDPVIYEYPNCRSVSAIGSLPCCLATGCLINALSHCHYARGPFARCMVETSPDDIVRAVKSFSLAPDKQPESIPSEGP